MRVVQEMANDAAMRARGTAGRGLRLGHQPLDLYTRILLAGVEHEMQDLDARITVPQAEANDVGLGRFIPHVNFHAYLDQMELASVTRVSIEMISLSSALGCIAPSWAIQSFRYSRAALGRHDARRQAPLIEPAQQPDGPSANLSDVSGFFALECL